MTTTVLVAPAGAVGRVVTEYGNYEIADGLVTVDSRAVKDLLGAGFVVQVAAANVADDISDRLMLGGGTTGQQLSKVDGTDYNVTWAAAS